MLDFIFGLPRPAKRFISVLIDCVLLSLAYWGSFWVRLDQQTPFFSADHWAVLVVLLPITLVIFIRTGLYRAVLRFVSFRVLWTTSLGVLISTVVLVLLAFYHEVFLPRSVPVIYFAFALILVGGSRLFFRMLYQNAKGGRVPVVIYGAGMTGRQLHLSLNQGNDYFVVGYVDDDPRLIRSFIQGLEVFNSGALQEIVVRHGVKKVLLALPNLKRSARQDVLCRLESLPCEVLSVPLMADLMGGRARVDELKEVSIDDLLGRDAAEPVADLMGADTAGKTVMVTGAGGSIGSELCRQIVRQKPARLVLFELSEYGLYTIEQELQGIMQQEKICCELVPVLGSVQATNLLLRTMQRYGVDTLYHAAAYKHVPLVEENIVEGVKNNVFGTLTCAEAAISSGVSSFVLVSTDKAVRPANIMGASKRLAELILQALSREQSGTRFTIVRFGNVLGSSGSVVPLFRQQIKTGGPITVTHEEVERFFMTIPEASQLVIQAGAMGKGGEVFVLDMGQPVKILELARRMVRLSGLTVKTPEQPQGDIEVKITGLRPGEKLYEELWLSGVLTGTEHPRIMTTDELFLGWSNLSNVLDTLKLACDEFDSEKVKAIFDLSAICYQPTGRERELRLLPSA